MATRKKVIVAGKKKPTPLNKLSAKKKEMYESLKSAYPKGIALSKAGCCMMVE